MVQIEQLFSPQRRQCLVATTVLLALVYTWASMQRLRDLVEAGDLEAGGLGRASLLRVAERNVLEHLPQRGAGLNTGGQDLIQGAPDDKAAAAGAGGGAQNVAKHQAAKQQPQQQKSKVVTVGQCRMHKNMDFWGDALVWGESHRLDSAEACCKACSNYKPKLETDNVECNVWVYCEDPQLCGSHHKECWLKHMAHPDAAKPSKKGPDVGWTTGFADEPLPAKLPGETSEDRRYHIVITAQGSAVHWQARVAYYWYKKVKAQCEKEGNCQMGGFTRLLHSGQPDELVEEVPTVVVNPLPPEHPNHGYVVLNRPYAFLQWIEQAKIPEKYVLMSEPDHLWLRPMPNLMHGERPAAFPFFYIEPWKKEFLHITQKFLGPISRAEAEKIAPIGNAPTLMSMADMRRVMPVWFNMSLAVHNDEEARKEWGWVQEMYAFTLSCTKVGIKKIDLYKDMMAQPPYDTLLAPYYILHYTYGNDYDLDGNFTPGKIGAWRFDKRTYHSLPPPRNLGEPPPGMPNELVRHLVHAINEASSKIPGWDEYAQTGKATQFWNGQL